ncbi:unnamed protein product [Mycena citricolor]|uniref:Uncharacterized protein n=1 Tax=Mycena citricolor TaxID=2018698 RepID=A0AAD2HVK2_9AGAR|nr:unnamed protein product [Mycena citricolor]CAK5282943.1 unnamed protein product [Mycena citricolor]CAK5282955.1 unnamed protein product [Mycena citricolor]
MYHAFDALPVLIIINHPRLLDSHALINWVVVPVVVSAHFGYEWCRVFDRRGVAAGDQDDGGLPLFERVRYIPRCHYP